MKKSILAVSVAALFFTACSNSEDFDTPQTQKEIALNPVAQKATRTPISGTSFGDGQKIYVSAYNSVSGNYFKGIEFSEDNTNSGTWKAGQYWPINGVTRFLAYAATADVSTLFNPTWGTKYADKVEFTVTNGFYQAETGTPNTPYIDLLYASGEQLEEKNYTAVSMDFKHSGAWIVFNVKLSAALTGAKVTLDSFKLVNLLKGGKLIVDNTTYPGAKASWNFTGVTPEDYSVESFTASTEVTTTASSFGVIIPEQNQTAIQFNYTLSSPNSAFDSQSATYTHNLDRFNKWEMGKKYVYNITISFSEIKIEPSVKNWEETSEDIDI